MGHVHEWAVFVPRQVQRVFIWQVTYSQPSWKLPIAIVTAPDPWRLRKRNSVIAASDVNWPNAADNQWRAYTGEQSWISVILWSCAGSMERRSATGFQVSSTVGPLSESCSCFYAQAQLPKSCTCKRYICIRRKCGMWSWIEMFLQM